MSDVMVRALFKLSAANDLDEETVVSQLDAVMTELLRMEQSGEAIGNAAVSLDLDEATVLVELLARGSGFEAAAGLAEVALHDAMTRAGGLEPTWATKVEQRAELITA